MNSSKSDLKLNTWTKFDMEPITVTLYAGDVFYDVNEAAVSIDNLIQMLEYAKEDGATHIVLLSGNYRGPRYLGLSLDFDWLEYLDD